MISSYTIIPDLEHLVAKTAKITISLPEELLRKADAAGEREHRTRSELVREALRWYLRIGTLPVADPTRGEIAAIQAGRTDHAHGKTLTHADIVHEPEDRVRKEGAKEPRKATA
jgi:metal-responsive CopG/Arc/MetJ family transcriptional regulator